MASAARPTQFSPGRAYWLCQLLGWGGYGLLYFIAVLLPFHAAGWANALADVVYCVIGLAGTHVLHARLRRHAWPDLPLPRLLPRLVLAAVVLAALMTAGLELAFWLLGIAQMLSWPVTMSIAVSSAGLIGIWMALYWIAHGVRRRRAAESQALEARILAREAQLRRLQAELNPHFLFNCLNGLRALIPQDPPRAQTMVTELAELLRYALRADRTPTVPLAEEWAAIEAYLALEGLRLEERLECRHDLAPAALEAAVPPMLLQGLVENAIKHGIAPSPAGGSVLISAAVTDGVLRLEVRNTGGLGRPGPAVADAGHGAGSASPGLGLANARQRLHLLYGEAAALRIEESPPGTTLAIVTLPYVPATEAGCAR